MDRRTRVEVMPVDEVGCMVVVNEQVGDEQWCELPGLSKRVN